MLKISRFPLFFTLLALSWIAAVPVQAASLIVTSFGSDYSNNASATSFLSLTGPTWADSSAGNYEGVATPFVPGANYDVTSVNLLLGWAGSGNDPTVDVGIYSDSSGSPGTLLDVLAPVTITAVEGTPAAPALYSASITGTVPIVEGEQYWIVVLSSASETFDGWYYNSDGSDQPYATYDGATWTASDDESQLYFDVMGNQTGGGNLQSDVPEPGALMLFGLGLGIIAWQRRRRSVGHLRQ